METMLDEATKLARDIGSGILDLIYPPFCLVCKQRTGIYLCAECIEKITIIQPPCCRKCGTPLDPGDFYCYDCRQREFAFDQACSAGTFDGVLREAIHELKYQYHLVMADPLADLLVRCFPDTRLIGNVDVVVPIPIHRSRLVERGFNQSLELARRFCKRVSLPLDSNNLIKHKNTSHQVDLPEDERALNVGGAFAVTKPVDIAGKRVLLLDDVFTTGSTLNEAALTLRNAGAAAVYAYTLAKKI